MDTAETQARLTAIEIALAHAEALIEDLDALAREQADRLDRLERSHARLLERLASIEARPATGPDAPPPHY
jgi:uncharacterized coiled-coil protein SlyX